VLPAIPSRGFLGNSRFRLMKCPCIDLTYLEPCEVGEDLMGWSMVAVDLHGSPSSVEPDAMFPFSLALSGAARQG
jgi:hypothetical protein